MPVENERPRPQGDPLENVIHDNPEANQAQRQSDATPEETGDGDRAYRGLSDRARPRGSSANGIPEFDEDSGAQRKRQYDEGAEIVSGTD